MTQTSAAKGRISAAINEMVAVMSNANDIELPTPSAGRQHITAAEKIFFASKVNVAKDTLTRAKSCMDLKIRKAEGFVVNVTDQEEALAYPAALALHLELWDHASVCQAYDKSLGRLHTMIAFLLNVEVEEELEVPQGGNGNVFANDQNASTIENDTDSMVENRRMSQFASSLLRMATPANRSSSPNLFGFARNLDARALNLSGIQEEEVEGSNQRRTAATERDHRDIINVDRGSNGQHEGRNRGAEREVRSGFPFHSSSAFADRVANNHEQFMNLPLLADIPLTSGSRIDNANGVLEDTFGIIDPDILPHSRNSLNHARSNYLSTVRSFLNPGVQNNIASQSQPIPLAQSSPNPIVPNVQAQVTTKDMQDMMQYMQSFMQQMATAMAPTTAMAPINATVPATTVAPTVITAAATGVVPNPVAPITVAATNASAVTVPAVNSQPVTANVTAPVTQVQVTASQTQVPLVQNAQIGTAPTVSTTAPAAAATPIPVNDPIAMFTALTRRKARVPSLTVPIFDGTPEKYHDWWRTFAYTVHENAEMSPGERIMYLKQCTTGEAAEMLLPYSIDETSYDECIAALKRRYENRLDESQRIFKKLSELPASRFEAKALRSTFTTVQASYIALKKIEPAENNTLLLDLISNKFPEKIRQKISLKKHQLGAKWSIAAIVDMIEEYVVQEENTVRDLAKSTKIKTVANAATVYNTSDRPSRSRDRYQGNRAASRSLNREDNRPSLYNGSVETKEEGPQIACELCGKYRHHAVNWRSVNDPSERRVIVRQKRLCYVCLSKNHMSADCKEPFCSKCGRAHHTSLCTAKVQTADSSASATRTKSPYRSVVDYRDKPVEDRNNNRSASNSSFRLTKGQTGTS